MIIRLPRHPNYLSQDPESISRIFLEQFALVFNQNEQYDSDGHQEAQNSQKGK